MSKPLKIITTAVVFTLIILFFVKLCGGKENNKPSDNSCQKFNTVLNNNIVNYFSNNLPTEDNETKSVEVDQLILDGYLLNSDLVNVGTTCTGSANITKIGEEYYYDNDIICGTCAIADLYNTWSDWSDTMPLLTMGAHVQSKILYNYGTSEKKYTDWSEWALDINTLKVDTPNGSEEVDTETETKTQYSYRDASYKWYKLSGGTTYYGGGSYSEKMPASGYSKDASSKTVSRTPSTLYTSESALSSTYSGFEYDSVTTPVKKTSTTTYIYSKTEITQGTCKTYKPLYQCYNETYSNTITSSSTYSSSSAAINACSGVANATNCATSCSGGVQTCTCPSGYSDNGDNCSKTSGGTYYFEANFEYYADEPDYYSNCTVRCTRLNGDYGCESGISKCLSGSGSGLGREYTKCRGIPGEKTITWTVSGSSYLPFSGNLDGISSCSVSSYSNGDGTTSYANKSCSTTPTVCRYTYQTLTTSYASGTYTTCPSGYPNTKPAGTSSECAAYNTITTTYYLKPDGTATTVKAEAARFTSSQYSALKVSGYTASEPQTTWGGYSEGTCPAGSTSSTCQAATMYKAKIYKFKWYKETEGTKSYYNNEAYSTSSPGKGYIKDTASIKWGDWTDFNDTKVTKGDSREVKTQVLQRIRKSYVEADTLKFDIWLSKEKFLENVGSTSLEEFEKNNKDVEVQTKIMYRYRLLK